MTNAVPILLGLCGGATIIAACCLLLRIIQRGPNRRGKLVALFATGFVLAGAGVIWIRGETMLRVGLGLMSLSFAWAGLATACEWPGFRDPPPNDGDDELSN